MQPSNSKPIALSEQTFNYLMEGVANVHEQQSQLTGNSDIMTKQAVFKLTANTTAATAASWTSVTATYQYNSGSGLSDGESWTIYSPMEDVITSGQYVICLKIGGQWMITAAINFCPA